jgi:hypothetical protein
MSPAAPQCPGAVTECSTLKCAFSSEVTPAGLVRRGGRFARGCGWMRGGLVLGSGRHVAMQLEPVDLGPADEEPGCIDSSDGVVVARRGLKSVHGRVIFPDCDDSAVPAAAPEQVPFEPSVGTEHRQRLLRGEALVFCGSCLIYLGPPDPHDHRPSLQGWPGWIYLRTVRPASVGSLIADPPR